jgi:hypothetical protein
MLVLIEREKADASEDYINYLRALPTQFIQNIDRDAIAI